MSNGVSSLFHRDGKSEGGAEVFSLGYGVVWGHTCDLYGQ